MSQPNVERVLFVDDDPNILASYQRSLRKIYQVETALGPEQGMGVIASRGPIAIVVTDMQMPGIDGIQFLTQVRKASPQTVRIMLTGHADQQTAIEAVNEGAIFRFLTKPCPPEKLARVLRAGLQQYRLVLAERELLERTLNGSVEVLTELLSLVNPAAFGRAFRIRRVVRRLVAALELESPWQYDLAALLSQIGCVTLSPDTIAKLYAGQPLAPDEQRQFAAHPAIGSRLLEKIPRLSAVAQMVAGQMSPYAAATSGGAIGDVARVGNCDAVDEVALGAQLLRLVSDYDQRLHLGASPRDAFATMREHIDQYNPRLLVLLEETEGGATDTRILVLNLRDLTRGMLVHEDIRASNGLLLVAKGQEISLSVLERLHSFDQWLGVAQPIKVEVPPEPVAAPPIKVEVRPEPLAAPRAEQTTADPADLAAAPRPDPAVVPRPDPAVVPRPDPAVAPRPDPVMAVPR